MRKIPLHGHLIELGFLDYLDIRPEDGKLLDLKYSEVKENWSHDPQRWFSRLKQRLGFGPTKVFHSFRHTMRDALGGVVN